MTMMSHRVIQQTQVAPQRSQPHFYTVTVQLMKPLAFMLPLDVSLSLQYIPSTTTWNVTLVFMTKLLMV